MNWFRTILDGVAMSAVFNSYVADRRLELTMSEQE
jgi:hypothetical protein